MLAPPAVVDDAIAKAEAEAALGITTPAENRPKLDAEPRANNPSRAAAEARVQNPNKAAIETPESKTDSEVGMPMEFMVPPGNTRSVIFTRTYLGLTFDSS